MVKTVYMLYDLYTCHMIHEVYQTCHVESQNDFKHSPEPKPCHYEGSGTNHG